MLHLTFTTKYSDKVEIAVDDLFQALLPSMLLEETEFDAVKVVDHAFPVVTNCAIPILSSEKNPAMTPLELSSGAKSILLILHRLKHSELTWIPSMDSMGTNAKDYILKHLLSLIDKGIPVSFPLYCTVCDFSSEYRYLPCLDTNGDLRTLYEIITGGY